MASQKRNLTFADCYGLGIIAAHNFAVSLSDIREIYFYLSKDAKRLARHWPKVKKALNAKQMR